MSSVPNIATLKLNNGGVNERVKNLFELIKKYPNKRTSFFSEKLGMPFGTVDRHIRVLLKKKLIIRKGSKKTGGYFVIKSEISKSFF